MTGEEDPLEEAEAMYHIVVAEVLRELGYADRAEESYVKAVSIDPWNTHIRVRYGAFLAHTGRLEAGLRELRAALEAEPGNAFARLNVALALEKSGQPAEAAGEIELCLYADPVSTELLATYARLAAAAGREEQAIACYRNSIALAGDNQRARYELGVLLARRGELAAARDELLEAVLLDPQDLAAAHNYGAVLEQLGAWDAAERRLRGLLAADPANPTARYRYGVLLERLGRLREAEAHYAMAVRLDPGDGAARLAYAAVLHRLNDSREPSQALQKLLDGRIKPLEAEEIACQAGDVEQMQNAYFYYIEP